MTAWIMKIVNHVALAFRGDTVKASLERLPAGQKPAALLAANEKEYNPDAETESLLAPVMNPVIAFHEALRANDPSELPNDNPFKGVRVRVSEAYIYEGLFNSAGKLADKRVVEAKQIPWQAPYRVRHVLGNDAYLEAMGTARNEWETALPARIKESDARTSARRQFIEAIKTRKLVEDTFSDEWSSPAGAYDPHQYTEFAPTYGGPFFKQLYLTDYLRMHALAFEAWNHNPIAKRIIEIMAQYSFGRRFKTRIKDPVKEKAWADFEEKYQIRENASTFWIREFCIYGEIMLNLETWQLIDPSTVWDIITDPDNIKKVYYYHQSYPTQYQMFTGFRVPGEPGSEKVPAQEYVVRQIPAYKVLHLRMNCVSNEKRGRSMLFPILGWLKRIKDLYNAIVVRQWLMSCFIWDDTVMGSASDLASHAAQYSSMPSVGSTFVHNQSVVRQPMPAIGTSGGRGQSNGIGEEIIAFIATAVGIPKEFLNVIAQGGGNRASALTSAEPFTKVVEDLQAKFEALLTTVAKYAFEQAGLQYKDGDIEFLFPSVTKDTTTETIKNVATGEAMGYISKQTSAEMFAGEMNITNYDFEDEQTKMQNEARKGLNQMGSTPIPPPGRLGSTPPRAPGGDSSAGNLPNEDEEEPPSPIHGNGKVALSKQLKTL